VVSFVAFHERGLGVPPSHFMRAIPHYYRVELHHLTPTPSHRLPFLRLSMRGTWGSSPTGSYGSTSSRRSTLLRKQARKECGGQCMLGAARSRCGWVLGIYTSRPNSSRRTTGGTIVGSTYAMTTATSQASPARS
jgi:hypothetical protein